MTKSEFLSSVPEVIEHPTLGYAELKIIANKRGYKNVCYRYANNRASYGTNGSSWHEVYQALSAKLEKAGFS